MAWYSASVCAKLQKHLEPKILRRHMSLGPLDPLDLLYPPYSLHPLYPLYPSKEAEVRRTALN